PRRKRANWGMTFLLAFGFAVLVTPIITTEHWVGALAKPITAGERATVTVRVPPFAGYDTRGGSHIGGGGGVVIARGDVAMRDDAINVAEIREAMPHGSVPYLAFFALAAVLAGLFSHHTRRSVLGRLVRVQIVNLALIAIVAVVIKLAMLSTAANVLIVPVA